MLTASDRLSTDGALSPDQSQVTLWLYQPGLYGRDALYSVWRAMEDDGATQQAFWDRAFYPDTCGDLASFIKVFDGTPGVHLAMVQGPPDQKLIGCIWVSDLMPGHQAFISIWMQRQSRAYAMEAGRQALDYVFAAWHLKQIWAVTPWQRALALGIRLGFHHVACLPQYCRFPTRTYDVHVLRLTKEAWHGTS